MQVWVQASVHACISKYVCGGTCERISVSLCVCACTSFDLDKHLSRWIHHAALKRSSSRIQHELPDHLIRYVRSPPVSLLLVTMAASVALELSGPTKIASPSSKPSSDPAPREQLPSVPPL